MKAYGWKMKYIMWKVNYQTLMMMLADATRYVTDDEPKKKGGSLTGYFQTRIADDKRNNSKT